MARPLSSIMRAKLRAKISTSTPLTGCSVGAGGFAEAAPARGSVRMSVVDLSMPRCRSPAQKWSGQRRIARRIFTQGANTAWSLLSP
jgi:hypothetical protein